MTQIRRVKTSNKAKAEILNIYDQCDKCFVIHYSCESFYNIENGRTPRITSIAVKGLKSGQITSFSIHKIAEQEKVDNADISKRYDELEKEMLQSFSRFVKKYQSYSYIHWNMRDINFGFEAIRHRAKVLGVRDINIDDNCKIDLAKLLKHRYGENYAGHPRLESLLTKNDIKHPHFLSGKAEAEAFNNQEYIKLHQSTLSKVECFETIIKYSAENKLKTESNWWISIYGVSPQSWYELVKDNWLFWLLSLLIGAGINELLQCLLNK